MGSVCQMSGLRLARKIGISVRQRPYVAIPFKSSRSSGSFWPRLWLCLLLRVLFPCLCLHPGYHAQDQTVIIWTGVSHLH